MRTAFHIAFYFKEDKLGFLNEVIEGLNDIPGDNRIFIYTTRSLKGLIRQDKGNIEVLKYAYSIDLLKPFYDRFGKYSFKHWTRSLGTTLFTHPFYLTWEHRGKMAKIVDEFDAQAYLEDDIFFSARNFKYWLENKDLCLKHNYNVGFLRYEVNRQTREIFYTDLTAPINSVVYLDNQPFLLNDNNPYSGFWILDKQELKKFMATKEWGFQVIDDNIREESAIGWNSLNMNRYRGSLLPIVRTDPGSYQLSDECLVHHLSDNYIGDKFFCQVKHPLIVQPI